MTKSFNFDFGFSAMDENELEAVQQASAKVKAADEDATEVAERLHKLYNMVTPLLNNLASNPEKDYIYWPQRLSKIEEFRDALDAVYSGK